MFQTVLFDLDGTLIDSEADIASSVNHVRGAHGLGPASAEEVRAAIGDGVRALLDRMLPGKGEEAIAAYVEHQEKHCLDRTQLYPGVREGLARIGQRCALAVVSNKPTHLCVRILEGLGVLQHFRSVTGGDTPAGRKPSPGPILRSLEALGRTPWDAIAVGDSPADLEAGRAAGCATCAVSWGYRDITILRTTGADHESNNFAELAEWIAGAAAPRNLYEALGRETFFTLAKRFYARVERDPRIRAMFPADLTDAIERQALFLMQFFGGPSEYAQLRGAPRLRMRHAEFPIDQAARDAWLSNMRGAIAETNIPQPARGILERYLTHTASFLVNR